MINFNVERTEKLPMGSIKNVVSEPIEGHEDYHMMVSKASNISLIILCKYTELRLLKQSESETDSDTSLVCCGRWKCGHRLLSQIVLGFWGHIECLLLRGDLSWFHTSISA